MGQGGGQQGGHDNHHAGPTMVFFVAFGMLIGAICRAISKRSGFPYTPMLLVVGLGLGYFQKILGIVGQGAFLISEMNPHMILFIFIPVLIFESGFNCDWYTFKKEIVNILLLAGPGVLWGAVVIAFCFKSILGYDDLTWNQALTLGCVLSATDPVAVVALLKQLGASVRFNTLIEGESLLNDGTAMVFFMMFLDMVKGYTSTTTDVIMNFVRIGLGGPLLGVVVGMIAAYYLKKVVRDDVMTANITFLSCYFCFWLAQYTFLKVSGILSIVVLGLFLSAVARTRIHPQSQHSLHSVWSYIQYICQTTIFLLTGIIISAQLIQRSTITSSDWVKMFIFFVLMNLCRAVMVVTFLPLLRQFGYGVSAKEFIVLVYGGLRGALGLCLGLLVAVDMDLSHRFRDITIFYVSGMATMTLLINGTTCGKLVGYVEMIEKPAIKEKLYRRCLKDIIKRTEKTIEELKNDRFLSLVDWDKVRYYIGDTKLGAKVSDLGDEIVRKSRIDNPISLHQQLKSGQLQTQLRYKTLKLIQKFVWQRYQNGLCEQNAAKYLSQLCNVNLDKPSNPIMFWQHLAPTFTSYGNLTFWMKAQSWPMMGNYARNVLVLQLYGINDIAANLIMAIEEVKEVMESFPIDEEYHKIQKEIDGEASKAENYLADLETVFPEMIGIIQMKRAVCTILKQRKEEYHDYLQNGFIDDSQLQQSLLELDKQLYALDELQIGVPVFRKQSLQFPIFSVLSNIELDYTIDNSTVSTFTRGTKLYQTGQPVNQIYLVVSGTVDDMVGSDKLSRGMGGLLSPANILSRTKQSYSTAEVTADGTSLRVIPMNLVYKLMINQSFRSRIFAMSVYYFSRLYKDRADFLATMEENKLFQYVRRSSLEVLPPGKTLELEFGGYIFQGEVQLEGYDESYRYGPYMYLSPGYRYHNQINRVITILQFRGLRPDHGGHHKKAAPRVSTINQEKNTRKSQLIGKLLDAPADDYKGQSHHSNDKMVEMMAMGERKSRTPKKRSSIKETAPPMLPPPVVHHEENHDTYLPPPVPFPVNAPSFGNPTVTTQPQISQFNQGYQPPNMFTQQPSQPTQPALSQKPSQPQAPAASIPAPPPIVQPSPPSSTIQHSSSIIRPGPMMPQQPQPQPPAVIPQPVAVPPPVAPTATVQPQRQMTQEQYYYWYYMKQFEEQQKQQGHQ